MKPSIKDRLLVKASFSLLILWICLCFLFYKTIIFLFPSHIHAWTQSDRLAIAYGFLENNFNFFKPQLYNLETLGGITRVDFPINEYVVALIMKITGSKSPVIFRIYTLTYSFIGLYFLFLLVYKYGKSIRKAFLVVIFVFTLPVFTYYQAGFLPTMTSLANIFIFYYFYIKSYEENEKQSYTLSIIFLTLAALTRTPFVIFLFAAFLHYILEEFLYKKRDVQKLVLFILAFGSVISYYLYNEYLGKKYGSAFLNSIMPSSSLKEALSFSDFLFQKWKYELATKYHYLAFASVLSYFIYQHLVRKSNTQKIKIDVLYYILISLIGTIIYFFLMQLQFEDHEYYFLDSLLIPLILLFVYFLCGITIDFKSKNLAWILLTFFSAASINDSKEIQKYKYTDHLWNRQEITRKNFINSDRLADSLHINKDAKILVLGSYSSNLPLMLMDRKGYTCISFTEKTIKQALQFPFDFLVVQNQFIFPDLFAAYPNITQSFTAIGSNDKITFFKRNKNIKPETSCIDFLGINSKKELTKTTFYDSTSWKWSNLIRRDQDIIINEGQEWGPTLNVNTKDPRIISKRNVFVHVKANGDYMHKAKLILTSEKGDSIIDFQESTFPIYANAQKNQHDYYFLMKIKPGTSNGEAESNKLFIHNVDKKLITVNQFDIIFY
ncbi:MAG: glycosyltransferase family 39 protein [Sporocytophaga sp.]|uniref:glycosyltransferase family 39 protein n=1 Tax=Sporocytophaga sp. TaxID=2231183 RepID=UPI001B210D3C|nr:glycosyltransferase family 39 protein [Sporocytophaga sp.]MBO9698726.1 glycosyltransferase family 39 protein [Sporocytophaga sp.]